MRIVFQNYFLCYLSIYLRLIIQLIIIIYVFILYIKYNITGVDYVMNICKYRPLYTSEILTILESKKVCNLIIADSEMTKVIPMWYIFDYDTVNDTFVFYLLVCTDENNLKTLKTTDNVSLFMENSVLGFYIDAYQSVTANGNPELITVPSEKYSILLKFKKKYSFDYTHTSQPEFTYMKIRINNISGRQY